jgi:hypothetical protein
MNIADEEIISLEDTLFQLNLLVDTSKSAAVKEAVLAEVITDGSVAVLDEYDITRYATDPLHEKKIMNILSKMEVMDTVEKIDDYISGKYWSSSVTGEMVMSAASAYSVDARLMMAIMEQDSRFGTVGVAVRTLNPGNVGNDDSGNTRTYESWQEGVTAVAEWLNRHRGSTIIPEISEETVFEPASPTITFDEGVTATSTPLTITPMATSTPTTFITIPAANTATSTPATATATSTPTTFITIPTTNTNTATSTPTTATSTPTTFITIPATNTATSTPATATSTPTTFITVPTTTTTTPNTATSTPITASTATTTPKTIIPTKTETATTTPVTATSTPTTTSTTTTATTTPITATLTPTTETATSTPIIEATTGTAEQVAD